MVFLRTGRTRTRPAATDNDFLPTYKPWHTSRHRLQQHIITALHIDPTLTPLIIGTDSAPVPTTTTNNFSERPFSNGVNRASASFARTALRSANASSPHRSTASIRNFISRPASSKSQPLRSTIHDDLNMLEGSQFNGHGHGRSNNNTQQPTINTIQFDSGTREKLNFVNRSRNNTHDDLYSSSASLAIHSPIPMQPMPESSLPLLLTPEESILPPQLPSLNGKFLNNTKMNSTSLTGSNLSLSTLGMTRSLRLRTSLKLRHAHTNVHMPTAPCVNPFTTAFLTAPSGTLDVMAHVTLDSLPSQLDLIRSSILLPFSAVPPHHDAHFISLVHGVRPPCTPFIIEPQAARLWHEDMTWRKEVRGTKAICAPHLPLDIVHRSRSSGHPCWPLFIAAVLARMLAVTAGLQQRGHECLRAVVALQSVREMLRLRSVTRAALRQIGSDTKTAVSLPKFGTLAVTADGWLALDGVARADPVALDMTTWRTELDVARGLVAWTNAEVDIAADVCAALKATRLSLRATPHWCRLALHTVAARDIDSAIAVIGVVRCLFVRKWTPQHQPQYQQQQPDSFDTLQKEPFTFSGVRDGRLDARDRAEYSASLCRERDSSTTSSDVQDAAALDHLCANEFVDRAVAIPDIERYLPGVLGVSTSFSRGHDIDCGALTTGEVLDAAPVRRGRRGRTHNTTNTTNSTTSSATHSDGDHEWSMRAVRRRRVVMSVWTDGLQGNEWCVPQSVAMFIDFRCASGRYRLSANKGDVRCARLGSWRRKHHAHTAALEASGATALCNALDRVYGDAVCLHALAWMQRGVIRVHDTCAAAAFVPRRSLGGSLVVNRRLPFQICRKMIFARKGHQLFWLPGEDLPPFRVSDRPSGVYQLTEVQRLPTGVELCRAEIAKDFG